MLQLLPTQAPLLRLLLLAVLLLVLLLKMVQLLLRSWQAVVVQVVGVQVVQGQEVEVPVAQVQAAGVVAHRPVAVEAAHRYPAAAVVVPQHLEGEAAVQHPKGAVGARAAAAAAVLLHAMGAHPTWFALLASCKLLLMLYTASDVRDKRKTLLVHWAGEAKREIRNS